VIEEKPEVRKAGGVYYTPAYIVDQIVEHTVGKLVEGKTPRQVSRLKVVDLSCGSGSFLIGAYDYLLDWHRQWYVEDGPEQHRNVLYAGPGGEWRLVNEEKKRILKNNIFGVDIDPQAVEVTKLSLLLKVLEGETDQTITRQLVGMQERALPDLDDNIKCGNSLIGPDFYNKRQMSFLDEEEEYRINVFPWQKAFPEVFKGQSPGFDAVIGNPPYIRIQALKEFAPIEVGYYKGAYRTAARGNYDIYVAFVEKGLSLLRRGGRLGFILPHKFFNAQYGRSLRTLVSEGHYLEEVIHFGHQQVFSGASTYTCLLFLNKAGEKQFRFIKVNDLLEWRVKREAVEGNLPSEVVTPDNWNFVVGREAGLFTRLSQMPVKLGDLADRIAQGIRTSANEVYVLDLVVEELDEIVARSKALGREVRLERDAVLMFLQGKEISPYNILSSGKVVIVPYSLRAGRAHLIAKEEYEATYPLTYAYLAENRSNLEMRERGRMRGQKWHAYVYPKNLEVMSAPKILVPDIAGRASFALDEGGDYAFASGYGNIINEALVGSTTYLLGLLNSRVLDFYLKRVSTTLRGGYFRYFTQFLQQLPIRTIDFSDPSDEDLHRQVVKLVEQMIELYQRLSAARSPTDRNFLQRQINATDHQIDRLVYELYGLTDEEITIVEEGSKTP